MTSQILNYNDEEYKELAKQILQDGYALLHEQNLTQRQLVEVCQQMGNVEQQQYFMNPIDNREISIVSGQKDENKKAIGMFGDTEIQWHANGASRHECDEIIVALYCVEECIDTVLSVASQVNCFAELSDADKERFRNIDIKLDASTSNSAYRLSEKNDDGALEPNESEDTKEVYDQIDDGTLAPENEIKGGVFCNQEDVDRRPLVGKHPIDGREYLYFMVPFLAGALENGEEINVDDLYDELWEKLFRSKYIFNHVFRKGDILFMDQLHTIHRRSPVQNLKRQLWRTAFDYSNIKF